MWIYCGRTMMLSTRGFGNSPVRIVLLALFVCAAPACVATPSRRSSPGVRVVKPRTQRNVVSATRTSRSAPRRTKAPKSFPAKVAGRVRTAWECSDGFGETFYRVGGEIAIGAGDAISYYGGKGVRRMNHEMDEFMRAPPEVKAQKALSAAKAALDLRKGGRLARKGVQSVARKAKDLWKRVRGPD